MDIGYPQYWIYDKRPFFRISILERIGSHVKLGKKFDKFFLASEFL